MQNPQYFTQGTAAALSLHIHQKLSNVGQSTASLSWQTGVVVPILVESVVIVADIVEEGEACVLNNLIDDKGEVAADDGEVELTLVVDEAEVIMVDEEWGTDVTAKDTKVVDVGVICVPEKK